MAIYPCEICESLEHASVRYMAVRPCTAMQQLRAGSTPSIHGIFTWTPDMDPSGLTTEDFVLHCYRKIRIPGSATFTRTECPSSGGSRARNPTGGFQLPRACRLVEAKLLAAFAGHATSVQHLAVRSANINVPWMRSCCKLEGHGRVSMIVATLVLPQVFI